MLEFGVFVGLIIPAFSLILQCHVSLNLPVYLFEMLVLLCFALVCIGDFKLSQLSCLSIPVGRASRLESVRRRFESHLCAAFSLEKVVSGLVLCCFVFLSLFLSHLSIYVHVSESPNFLVTSTHAVS